MLKDCLSKPYIKSEDEVNLVEDLNLRIRYERGKISSHNKSMISLNLKYDAKNMSNNGEKVELTKYNSNLEHGTLIIAIEDDKQNEFVAPLNISNKLVKDYKFLQKVKSNDAGVQLVDENTKKKIICNMKSSKKKSTGCNNSFIDRVISIYDDVKYFFNIANTFLYVITPPTKKSIVRKAAFHPPARGKNYFLTNNSEHSNLVFKSAEEAHGHKNVILCLPSLINERNVAVDLFQQVLRTRVKIIENRLKTKIVTLLCRCVHSYKTNKKSPYLIIFSQPNSSDITDPNFVDVADYLNIDVLVYDYGGFGLSQSKPGEEELFADIDAVFEYACNGLKYQPENIILFGFSMGTAVSVYLASRIKDLAGVILLAPFTSLLRVLFQKPKEEKTSRYDQFVTVDRINKIKAKTLIIHGTNDSMVSLKHSMILFSKLNHPATPLWLPGATHQSVYCEKETWRRIKTFCKHELNLKKKWKHAVFLKKKRRLNSVISKAFTNTVLELSSSNDMSDRSTSKA
uniref:Hydrolase_4 domain-containing protein n=1 Tax=Parastrongyloides trichosuri TaxID=131310 RepID=A0A0N4ZLU2_PARTI